MDEFLFEAEQVRDPEDEAQGFVRIQIPLTGYVYGHVASVVGGIVALEQATRWTPRGLIVRDHVLRISLGHIITASYANLAEVN